MEHEEKKVNHPFLAYVIGLIFAALSLAVGAGVLYHLGVSHHGPGLLRPFFEARHAPQLPILTESERREKMAQRNHFHQLAHTPRPEKMDDQACLICHSDLPHQKNKKVRSLLNMHFQYMVCESCHVRQPEAGRIIYKWARPDDPNPEGPFIGTRYADQTGFLKPVEDTVSKITPFLVTQQDGETSMVYNQDTDLAYEFMRQRFQLTQPEIEGVKQKYHKHLAPKGLDCQACHTKAGALDFRALGFSDQRIDDLVYLNIKGMLTKYEVFSLPDLLSGGQPRGEETKGEGPKQ